MFRRHLGVVLCGLISVGFVPGDLRAISAAEASAIALNNAKSVAGCAVSSLLSAGVITPLITPLLLRGKKLSPEAEQAIRKTLREMGVEDADSVNLREFNGLARVLFGKANAHAIGGFPLMPRHILIGSQQLFDELPDAEKRFLIGQESAYLTRRHAFKGTLAGLLAGGLIGCGVELAGAELLGGNMYLDTEGRLCVTKGVSMLASLLASAYLCRKFKKQADLDAAEKLRNASGGRDLMQRLKLQRDKRGEKVLGLAGLWNWLVDTWGPSLATQSSLDTRAAYLEKIAEEQARSHA